MTAIPGMDRTEHSRTPVHRPYALRVAVGIATVGRPAVIARMLTELSHQTRTPDAIIVCSPSPADVDGVDLDQWGLRCITSARGLPHQRNAILHALTHFDVVVFLDDDFLPCSGYVEAVEAVFLARPEVVMTTGQVIDDGIRGPGLDFADAQTALADDASATRSAGDVTDVYNGYGCNMSVRLAAARQHGIAFDEGLPLYAWLEDVDFSRRLARHGRIVKVDAARGVHLGIKSGRQSGRRLGYSQIANPIYLARKGTCSWRKALFLMSRNMMANVAKATRPEPYVDRLGRARGNGRALLDLLIGRLSPTRVLNL